MPYVKDDEHCDVLRHAIRALEREGVTLQKQAENFQGEKKYTFEPSGVNKFLSYRETTKNETSPKSSIRFPNWGEHAWDWFDKNRPDLLGGYQTIGISPFIRELKKFFGILSHSSADAKILEKIRGEFALYRYHFLFPEKNLLLCALQCGEDGDLRKFRIKSRYILANKTMDETTEGEVMAFGNSLHFYGKIKEVNATFQMVIDSNASRVSESIHNCAGALLIQSADGLPFCSAVCLIRDEDGETVEPGVLGIQSAQEHDKHSFALHSLANGFIDRMPKV